jgi:uncharacterized membrane protein YphA (DoxX/SURF4 family)
MKKDPKVIGYWILTALIAIALLGSGVSNLAGVPEVMKSYDTLGFPAFLAMILGTWKVLGALVILAPRTPRLKEWAHAGVTFSMTGAAASHLLHGDPVAMAIPPLVLTLINLASWWLRPESRKL